MKRIQYKKEWYKKNRRRLLKYARKYRLLHAKKIKKYNLEHREKNKKYCKRWHTLNPLKPNKKCKICAKLVYTTSTYCLSCSKKGKRNPGYTDGKSQFPNRHRVITLKSTLKKLGSNMQEYTQRLKKQGGVCAICRGTASNGNRKALRLSIDHNHKTGQVRGLLCSRCNFALGAFKENIRILSRAKQYLTYWETLC